MKVEAVIFDFGGVLMRTVDRKPRTELAARLGMNYADISALVFESPSALKATQGIITAEQHWAELQKTLDLPDKEFEKVRTEFWAGDILDQNLVNLLRELRPSYTTILLSNAWDDLRHMIEDVWQINDAFDRIVISAEIGLAKPDLAIYQWVFNELGVNPATSVFVDDFLHNVEAAREVGMHAIHFRSPEQALDELRSLIELA